MLSFPVCSENAVICRAWFWVCPQRYFGRLLVWGVCGASLCLRCTVERTADRSPTSSLEARKARCGAGRAGDTGQQLARGGPPGIAVLPGALGPSGKRSKHHLCLVPNISSPQRKTPYSLGSHAPSSPREPQTAVCLNGPA